MDAGVIILLFLIAYIYLTFRKKARKKTKKEATSNTKSAVDFTPNENEDYLNSVLADGKTIRQAQNDSYNEAIAASKRYSTSDKIQDQYDFMVEHIQYSSSNPSKIFELNEYEKALIYALADKLIEKNIKNRINLIRMANGALSVNYGSYPIGKIKLTGKKTYMQILKSYDHYSLEDLTIDEYINNIDKWITYIRRL